MYLEGNLCSVWFAIGWYYILGWLLHVVCVCDGMCLFNLSVLEKNVCRVFGLEYVYSAYIHTNSIQKSKVRT